MTNKEKLQIAAIGSAAIITGTTLCNVYLHNKRYEDLYNNVKDFCCFGLFIIYLFFNYIIDCFFFTIKF